MSVNGVNQAALALAQKAKQNLAANGVNNPTTDQIVAEMKRLKAVEQSTPVGQPQNREITTTDNKPPKPQTTFQLEAQLQNLERTKESADTINMQINAEKTKQAILTETKALDIEGVANAPDKNKQAEVIDQFISVAVNGEKAKTNAESLKNIANTKLSEEQKEQLKADLNAIKGMDLAELSQEFGITVDLSALKNLDENAKPEDVKAQLKVVEDILAQIKGAAGNPPTGLEKVKAEREAADKTIALNNKTIAYYEDLYNKRVANGELTKDEPNPYADKIGKLQEANLAALKVVAKADSLTAMITPVVSQLTDLKTKLSSADTNLTNIAKFDVAAEARKTEQIKAEDKAKTDAESAVKNAQGKRDKAAEKMGKAKNKDTDFERYDGDKDEKVQGKVDKKNEKVKERQKTVDEAIKDRTEANAVITRRTDKQQELDQLRSKKDEWIAGGRFTPQKVDVKPATDTKEIQVVTSTTIHTDNEQPSLTEHTDEHGRLILSETENDAIAYGKRTIATLLDEETIKKIQIEPKYIAPDPNSSYESHKKGGWTVIYKHNGQVLTTVELINIKKGIMTI